MMASRSVIFLTICLCASVLWSQESYPVHPDSTFKEGVPRGTVEGFEFANSKIFPGTKRKYFVYVPAQYQPSQPAALMVLQDGEKYVRKNSSWNLPAVFDNLIARGEMPVTIAVCVNPGVVDAIGDAPKMSRFNRSFEYDSVSSRYANFLVEELLPEVSRKYSITSDPNLRGVGGSSSGAIAAFTAAWHRPDQFRRVFSAIGTYVGLRGGNEYPTLIRKTEPRPLRIFLQDGSNDLNIYGGDWWHANLSMLTALRWAGYQVKNEWGEGGHNGKHGSAVFADAMRWLWKDHGKPIANSFTGHPELKDRFIDQGVDWQKRWTRVVGKAGKVVDLVAIPNGSVLLLDPSGTVVGSIDGRTGEMADGPAEIPAKVKSTLHWAPVSIEVSDDSDVPATITAMTKTPDHRFSIIGTKGRFLWSYAVDRDGRLKYGQPFGYVHSPLNSPATGVTDLGMMSDGFVCVATKMGLQLLDQPGRVHVIIPGPGRRDVITQFAFGGEDFSMLYIKAGGVIYKRPTKMRAVYPWMESIAPPRPRL